MPITDLPQNLPDTSPDAASDVASGAALLPSSALRHRCRWPLPSAAERTPLRCCWPAPSAGRARSSPSMCTTVCSRPPMPLCSSVKTCAQHAVPLKICRVDARHAPGQSPEDAARQLRYATLIKAANEPWPAQGGVPMPRSQPGSGAACRRPGRDAAAGAVARRRRCGLAAMPAQWSRAGLAWYRPLLDLPGQVLRDWLAARGQEWVEDPSNADARYTRNRIRAQLLPALHQAFPSFAPPLRAAAGIAPKRPSSCRRWPRPTWVRWATRPASPHCRR